MTAKDFKRLHTLRMQHHRAIQALVSGATAAQAADLAGVHRVTVMRWRLYHPTFRAELNRRRVQALEAATDSLRTLLPGALVTLADQLRIGEQRGRLAVDVLRRAEVFDAVSVAATGPTEELDFVDQEVRRRRAAAGAAIEGTDDPDATSPISDDEREAMFAELIAQAEDAPIDTLAADGTSGDSKQSGASPGRAKPVFLPAILPFSSERTPAIGPASSTGATITSRMTAFS